MHSKLSLENPILAEAQRVIYLTIPGSKSCDLHTFARSGILGEAKSNHPDEHCTSPWPVAFGASDMLNGETLPTHRIAFELKYDCGVTNLLKRRGTTSTISDN